MRAVEVTSLPDASATITGVINVQGKTVRVVDVRLHLPASSITDLELNDQLIIARNGESLIAIAANVVNEVAEFDSRNVVVSDALSRADINTDVPHGVIATGDDIIFVRRPSHFLIASE